MLIDVVVMVSMALQCVIVLCCLMFFIGLVLFDSCYDMICFVIRNKTTIFYLLFIYYLAFVGVCCFVSAVICRLGFEFDFN